MRPLYLRLAILILFFILAIFTDSHLVVAQATNQDSIREDSTAFPSVVNEGSNVYEAMQGIGSILAVMVSLGGFAFIYLQIKQTNKTLKQATHSSIYLMNADIIRIFVEHKELRPYFYEGKKLEVNDPLKDQVLGVAETLADFFEFFLEENETVSSEIYHPWLVYMKNIYHNSPAIRQFLQENRSRYSKQLKDLLKVETRLHSNDREVERV